MFSSCVEITLLLSSTIFGSATRVEIVTQLVSMDDAVVDTQDTRCNDILSTT
jgi:hypothetical protein